ncbi:PTS sugar transporter subunit IIA [Lentisphaera profundi]|uniref:PTS sugar transporter subunit IIA n=1 Tax=Lentisphaera profundi TaxID=1658616 RepID=A0ABY7VW79_9BACT|nr:PTS sugar transporter subunit IIA [Lentisphaera profundi]WDE97514.1 PTS sugar transporter subunit IIA [Lentisphaera profundi]
MKLVDYIDRQRIIFLDSTEVNSALAEMVDASQSKINNSANFLQALINREELMSTGFGFGIAYPHAKTDDAEEFFVTIGISKPGIDWKSFDQKKAQLIFMIGGPDGQQDIYLKLLAGLSSFLKNSQLHDQLSSFCEDIDSFYQFIVENLNQ